MQQLEVVILDSSRTGDPRLDALLTTEGLQSIAATAEGKPITIDFNRGKKVGEIVSAKVRGNQLVAVINVDIPAGYEISFCVPGIIEYGKTGKLPEMTESALTLKPIQKTLTPIYREK